MEKVFLVLGIASVALVLIILAKRGVFTGMSFSGSGTGSSTPSSGKKTNTAPLVGFLKRFAAYVAFVVFLGFLGSEYPDSFLGTIWQAWRKFSLFFWGSHILMIGGIAIYQYDLHSNGLIRLWFIFVPFGVLFIALGGNLKNAKNIFSTPAGGDAGNEEIEIIVTKLTDGTAVYRGPTPWQGGEYFLVNVEVVCSTAQQGRSVRIHSKEWTADVFLVACGQGEATFPSRHEGNKVVVTAVQ